MKKIIFSLLAMLSIMSFNSNAIDKTINTVTKLTAKQYTTSKQDGNRLTLIGEKEFSDKSQSFPDETEIFLSDNKKFQTVLGIGGALTDASAETFFKMPESLQKEFLKAYYNQKDGIGYTLGRTNIHSCDFSSDSYTYVADKDSNLSTFSVNHDLKFRIPFIKQAIAEAGGKLVLFASPWSPPAWMKDNNDMLHGGKLLDKYRQSWSNYFVKFIQAYEKNSIPIWGITVQNEPLATQTWESCIYTANDEREFVKNFLGPTLQNSGMADKKIIIWDHNRDLAFQQADDILNDPDAAKYIWGTGFHWYEDWSGSKQQYQNIQEINEAYPDKKLLFTEGCWANFNLKDVYDWKLGERYGEAMINDFNNGSVGWTDWNVLLDEKGGPNHVNNFCFAPIHYNTKTNKLIYTNSYYYIGQFSKFIKPGAKRITASSTKSYIITTAFENIDGKIAVVVMNQSEIVQNLKLWFHEKTIQTALPASSISTFVID